MSGAPGRPAGLLLDLDGTLVLSERVHRLTWQHFFDGWGVEVDDGEYQRTFMGRRAADVLAAEAGPWSGRDLHAVSAEMTAYAQTLGHEVAAVPGAAEFVRRVTDAGVPVAVVTSAAQPWAEEVLGAVLDVRDRVTALVTSEQVSVGKPDPEGYLRGCALLGLDPAECAGLEDSPSGVRALLSARVGDVIGVTTTSAAGELLAAGAHRTVADLADASLRALADASP